MSVVENLEFRRLRSAGRFLRPLRLAGHAPYHIAWERYRKNPIWKALIAAVAGFATDSDGARDREPSECNAGIERVARSKTAMEPQLYKLKPVQAPLSACTTSGIFNTSSGILSDCTAYGQERLEAKKTCQPLETKPFLRIRDQTEF
jgi:hypothetical protein